MIKLGSKVKDVVSGFIGIVIGRYEYLYGCTRYGVQPMAKEGETSTQSDKSFDEPQLIVLAEPSDELLKTLDSGEAKVPGGPCPYTPGSKDPS